MNFSSFFCSFWETGDYDDLLIAADWLEERKQEELARLLRAKSKEEVFRNGFKSRSFFQVVFFNDTRAIFKKRNTYLLADFEKRTIHKVKVKRDKTTSFLNYYSEGKYLFSAGILAFENHWYLLRNHFQAVQKEPSFHPKNLHLEEIELLTIYTVNHRWF